ncbi:hypothetical protein CR513_46888, partial [Mucuna pruriens]
MPPNIGEISHPLSKEELHDESNNDITYMIIMESVTQVKTVPASNMDIESLKKVKVEDGAVMEEKFLFNSVINKYE